MGTEEAELGLVERARAGDRGAFREIVETHQARLHAVAVGLLRDSHDAEDAVQEAFLRAYRGLSKFRGGSRVGTWLYRITVNVCLESRRRRRPAPSFAEPVAELDDLAEGRPEADPERRAAAAGLRRAIDAAVLRLSPLERAAFTLRHDGGLPLLEIAGVLGRAEGTVKALLFRALRKLRRDLRPWRAEEAGS